MIVKLEVDEQIYSNFGGSQSISSSAVAGSVLTTSTSPSLNALILTEPRNSINRSVALPSSDSLCYSSMNITAQPVSPSTTDIIPLFMSTPKSRSLMGLKVVSNNESKKEINDQFEISFAGNSEHNSSGDVTIPDPIETLQTISKLQATRI